MSEKKVENEIKKWLTSIGSYFIKVHGSAFMPPGIPDILACVNGFFIGIEVKRPGAKREQSEAQKVHEHNILKAKGLYLLVDSLEETMEKVNEFINNK